jgi:hypothetical protein
MMTSQKGFSLSIRSYLIFLCLTFGYSFAQHTVHFKLQWKGHKVVENKNEVIYIPSIEGQEPDNGKPVFFHRWNLTGNEGSIQLIDYKFTMAPEQDLVYLKRFHFIPEDTLSIIMKVTKDCHVPFAVVHLFPYIWHQEKLMRVTELTFKLGAPDIPVKQAKIFKTQSVLDKGSGSWYKIGVTEEGIHKIDKSFFELCGISTKGLDPNSINIFGNGEGRLPEVNGQPCTDDLAKNAIFISGDSDGSFDDGDYILFYGWGPNRWRASGTSQMDQDKNIYSDQSFYFLNINPIEPPLRITNKPIENATPTHFVSSYSYCDVYERDLVNLVGGGQRWYGELFDTDLEQQFDFNIPDIDNTSPIYFKTSIATNSVNSVGTAIDFSVNGLLLSTSPLPTVSNDYIRSVKSFALTAPDPFVPLRIKVTRNSPNTIVYLDRILLNARRRLVFMRNQFNFRDLTLVGTGKVASYSIQNMKPTAFVWDVSDRHIPFVQQGLLTGSEFNFVSKADTIIEFVASDGVSFLSPSFIGVVDHQNLHALAQAKLLIVTHEMFLNQAERLASLHDGQGISTHVVTTSQVYNEFSSGMQDPTAIRRFVKMFYDRSASKPQTAPRHLLLFGDGTYDPKNRISNNNNYVVTYQALNSENHISAMVTDDYFAMLDDGESISPTDLMDVGVGRLLVSDLQMAKEQVDKIEHYMKNGSMLYSSTNANCGKDGFSSTFGDWRTNYVQIADDEEDGYFIIQDTEPQYKDVKSNQPEMNCDKLYCDAFTQVVTAGGERYPDVFNAITDRVERGALVLNYVGHGGEVGLAQERIVTVPQIQSWKNIDRLNLFVSATCEFTKYDDPSRVSAGEWVSLNPNGGAIALMTTSRSVFFGVNTLTGLKFFETVFSRDTKNEPLEFGEIMRRTKNGSGASDNKRSFTLIGDPALKIALPRMKIVTDSINGLSPAVQQDTLKALSKVTIKGHLEDFSGNKLNDFSGTVVPSIFDKPKIISTLSQNPDSPIIDFELQKNVVYRGKATVTNGEFMFSFIVPKDINYSLGRGKISYYAYSSSTDAIGSDSLFYIGGFDTDAVQDVNGPDIDLYINDKNFVSGGVTDETPVLIAKLFDQNGVNTVGSGIGHDLTAVIDGNTAEPIVLNNYYTSDIDSYQSGEVRYTFPRLEKGRHVLTLKVWDVNNNSSEKSLEFNVVEKQDFTLSHVINYPNPFTTHTSFYFEHNQICSQLEAQIQVFTVSGKLVRTINQTVNTPGFRSQGVEWDGKDDFGDQLAKGVYVYAIKVNTSDGLKAEKIEKLVLLR